jgi:hypothetical protein
VTTSSETEMSTAATYCGIRRNFRWYALAYWRVQSVHLAIFPVGNTVIYIPRAMMRRVDGEESILGTELVEPK